MVKGGQERAAWLAAAPPKGLGVTAALLQIPPAYCGDPESSQSQPAFPSGPLQLWVWSSSN